MSGDIRTGIAGIGNAGFDIYTKFPPGGVTPPPPQTYYMLMENGSDEMLMENGTDLMILE